MQPSASCLALIKYFEALRLKAYKPTPQDVWTIGYGHTKGVREGDTCSKEQADAWLSDEVSQFGSEVWNDIPKPTCTSQNQFDAMVSLAYNIGTPAFKGSTVLRLHALGDYLGAANAFLLWNKQAGRVLAGLSNRRQKEKALYETP